MLLIYNHHFLVYRSRLVQLCLLWFFFSLPPLVSCGLLTNMIFSGLVCFQMTASLLLRLLLKNCRFIFFLKGVFLNYSLVVNVESGWCDIFFCLQFVNYIKTISIVGVI